MKHLNSAWRNFFIIFAHTEKVAQQRELLLPFE